ncbi:hypothetical protein Leryth_024706 [Lithospermum erythrorhizon]|nr:hypothetical protein Leryth_024706 [Lithospermum erythrorhizon]
MVKLTLSFIIKVEAWTFCLKEAPKKFICEDFLEGNLAAVSGSGQQHGSVYWKKGSLAILSSEAGNTYMRSYRWSWDESNGYQGKSLVQSRIGAPGLEEKIGDLAPAHSVAGVLAQYYLDRYHFNKDCLVIHWSGDNPNSLAGLTLNTPGDLAISLGTSDTVFGITTDHEPCLEGHVFPNPVDSKGYMVMLCYKNGSLTREEIRNHYASKSWDVFNKFLEQTSPLNGGQLGFYYMDPEILPPLPAGYHKYVIDNFNGVDTLKERQVPEFDPPSEVRAIVEGQLLSMRGHAERFGMPSPPRRIIATGGASANNSILKVVASIFGCDVYTVEQPDSASLGAALRAAHGWLCNKKGNFVPISAMYMDKLEKTSLNCKLAVPGDAGLVSKYAVLKKKRMEMENNLVEKFGRL